MKKALSILLVAVMCIAVLASCDLIEHEHVFATDTWSSDDDFHWHACEAIMGCKEQGDRAAHDFEVTIDEAGKPMNRCKICGATNYKVQSAPEHEHEFTDEFASNENFHWYACTVEGCYEAEGKVEHVFGNPEVTYGDKKITVKYVCVDCGYEKVEEQEVKTEVDDAVSWNEAFKNFKLTNFTMDVHFEYKSGSEREQNNHCIVTKDSAYYCIPGYNEFYTVKNSDGTCTTYYRRGRGESFTLSYDKSDAALIGAQTETVIQVSFENNFEKFTYDEATASYVCKDLIEAICYRFDGSVLNTLYCYNNVVKITDGKISYISADYYFEESDLDEEYKCFKYYNIGISAVEIPQSIINGASKEDERVTTNENSSVGGNTYPKETEESFDANYDENAMASATNIPPKEDEMPSGDADASADDKGSAGYVENDGNKGTAEYRPNGTENGKAEYTATATGKDSGK